MFSGSKELYGSPPLVGGVRGGVQTGNIVYKIVRVHGLHFMARRTSYAMESDKPNGTKEPACNRPR